MTRDGETAQGTEGFIRIAAPPHDRECACVLERVRGRVYASAVGTVTELDSWRRRRAAGTGTAPAEHAGRPVTRLESAVARLERLVRGGTGRISVRVETELLAITGAVAAGRTADAADRAERLAERLEHPSSRLAR
jgi:hypothetical protein